MTQKSIFLLLGGNKLNFGIYKKFKDAGMQVYVVDWNEVPQISGDRHYRLDVKDGPGIVAALKNDHILDDVAFVYSSIDLAVPAVAYINRALGLKTISDDAMHYSSSKSMMVKKWKEDGLLNRISDSYTEYSDKITDAAQNYALIIKPDNSSSSRGITICKQGDTEDTLKLAFDKARDESSNKIVVVEEFVIGTEFTVEMLGDAHGNVSVYAISKKTHTTNIDRNKIAVKLHYNAVDDVVQNKIADYAIRCYKSLGFSSSLGHLEILLKQDGTLSPVEIGARSSGFIASDLSDIVSGRDYLMDLYAVYQGKEVSNGLLPQTAYSSMYFFYDFPDNCTVHHVSTLLDYCDPSIRSRYHDRAQLVQGASFKKIDNDNARVGFEILEGPRHVMTEAYIEETEKKMLKAMMH